MALSDGDVVLPGKGYAFINATAGQAAPATTQAAISALDLTAATLATSWTNLGHTSRDNNVSLGRDGGDVTTRGSWQNDALRADAAAVTWNVTINALQISNENLALYFGGGDATGTDVFVAPDSPSSQIRALWICLVDGSTRLPIYIPKVSFHGADAIDVDPENFLEFSLRADVVKATSSPLMALYHSALGA